MWVVRRRGNMTFRTATLNEPFPELLCAFLQICYKSTKVVFHFIIIYKIWKYVWKAYRAYLRTKIYNKPIKLTAKLQQSYFHNERFKNNTASRWSFFLKVLINETYGKKNYYNGECWFRTLLLLSSL